MPGGCVKPGDLIRLLALAPEHRLARERALDLLWPEPDVAAPAQALHKTVHAIRKVLEPERAPAAPSASLSFERGTLALFPGMNLWVDVEAFEAATVAARRSRDFQAYQSALDLYAGDLAVEDTSIGALAGRWAELRALCATLLAELANLHALRGEREEAILTLHRLIAAEPTREDACQALMRLYASAGRRYEALRQYQHLRDALRRELDAEPAPATQRLYEAIQGTRSSDEPGMARPRTGRARPKPDGQQTSDARSPERAATEQLHPPACSCVTSFVGRRRECVEVARLLVDARLVMLTGAGGSGKTRLAEQVASEVAARYRDGVVRVHLAALADPQRVPQALAAEVGVREAPSRPLMETLVEALREREVLLLLDNCEHLRASCAELAETLLVRCPRLRMLATSRRPLGLTDETVWRVPPLGLPDGEHLPPLDELVAYDAVHLFLERAASGRPGFGITPENALAVLGICRRLDGIPLAIELAAGRVRFLTPGQILARLNACFSLLADGGPGFVPRQQTMHTAIEWSYSLLGDAERRLLRRLAVFASGWTLDAAEEICADDDLPREEILPLLGRLVDQSLVVAEEQGEAMRYRMLEVIRQFAGTHLASTNEAADVRRRHAEWCLRLAEEAEPHLTAEDQHDWLAMLDRERENLRAALLWSQEDGGSLAGLRLASALMWYWYSRGMLSEGRQWIEELLAACGAAGAIPLSARAKALAALGVLAVHLGDHPRAMSAAEEALPAAREVGDVFGMLRALSVLGDIAEAQGNYVRLTALAEQAVALARTLDKPHSIAVSLSNLGDAEWNQGRIDQAEEHYRECLAVARACGDTRSIAMAFANLGRVAHRRGEIQQAITNLEESARIFGGLGDLRGTADALAFHAAVLRDSGNARSAIGRYLEGLTLYERAGCHALFAEYLPGLAAALAIVGRCRDATHVLGAAEALRERLGLALDAADRTIYERTLATIRAALLDEERAAAWTAGRAMSPAQLLAGLTGEPPAVTSPAMPPSAAPPPEAAAKPQATPRGEPSALVTDRARLTPREREIAALVGSLTNTAIAARLNLRSRTIDTHVTHILAKTGLRNRHELAEWMATQRPLKAEQT